MDYESALEYIHHCIDVGNIVFEMPQDKEIIDAIKIALEKQIPKKLVNRHKECDVVFFRDCPICGKSIIENENTNYCPSCGQRLDWN